MYNPEETLDMESFMANINARPKAYIIDAENIEHSRLTHDINVWDAIAKGCWVIDVIDSNEMLFFMPGDDDAEVRLVLSSFNFVQLP
jgi:AAA+ superfamily predicted ATPase